MTYIEKDNNQVGVILTNEKPHTGDSIGLKQALADIAPVTTDVLEKHSTLCELVPLIDDGVDSNSVLYLDSNIAVFSGDDNGNIIDTTNTIALVLLDNQNEIATLASYSIDHPTNRAVTHDTALPCAFVIGNIRDDGDLWCVDSISEGVKLYQAFNSIESVAVLVCTSYYQFNDVVKHFAEVKQVNINVPSDKKDKVSKQLAGVNALLWATVAPIADCLDYGELPSDIMNDKDNTVMIDLAMMAWGKPEPLENDPSKPTPYPVEAWGEVGNILRDAVEATAYHSNVGLPMAGQSLLGTLSTIGQAYVNAPRFKGHHFSPTSLFLLTEEVSGGGKTSTKNLTDKAIHEWQKQQNDLYKKLKYEWQCDKASTPKKDLEVWKLQNPPPQKKMITARSGTLQGFLDRYLLNKTYSMAWVTGEAGQFLSGHSIKDPTSKANIGCICDIWSGGGFDRVLSQRGESSTDETGTDDIRFSLDLQGQPPVINEALANEDMNDQGLLPRFLFTFSEPLNDIDYEKTIDRDDRTDERFIKFRRACHYLLDPSEVKKPFDENGEPKRLNMPFANREARLSLARYHTQAKRKTMAGGEYEYYFPYAMRLAENASRIATLFAFFRGKESLTTDDIVRASKLTDYSIKERIRYDKTKHRKGQTDEELLSKWLVDRTKNKTPKAIGKAIISQKCPNKLRGKKLNPLLEYLESLNHIKIEKKGKAITVLVNPILFNS